MGARKLRVLVVHNRYRSLQPGGEDRVVDQETALLADSGVEVTTFGRSSDDIASKSLLGKALVPVQVPWSASARVALRAQLQAQRPDVVHIHNTFPLLSPSVVAACADVGVPAVATLHNYLQVCPRGTLFRDGQVCTECTGRLPVPAVRHGCYRDSRLASVPLALNMVANRSRWWVGIRRFFCISEAQRALLIQGGMPAHLLAVKHNFVVDPGVQRSRAGKHVLYLGRLTEEKGLHELMRAWEQLAGSGIHPVPLVIAGTGPLENVVRTWAAGRGDVHYLGLRSRAECQELTAQAAAVVAPSIWLESFGLTVVEAMAAAVPVAAAAHGAFPELVQDRVTGFLHPPGDVAALASALRRLLADTDRNMALGRAARRSYEAQFTPEIGLAALLAGYEAAIEGRLCAPV